MTRVVYIDAVVRIEPGTEAEALHLSGQLAERVAAVLPEGAAVIAEVTKPDGAVIA